MTWCSLVVGPCVLPESAPYTTTLNILAVYSYSVVTPLPDVTVF